MSNSKKNSFISSLIIASIGLVIGIIIAILGPKLLDLAFIILGLFVIIDHLPAFISSLANIKDKQALVVFVLSAISIAAGFVMMFWHEGIFMILVGIYLLALPIYRIIIAPDKKLQLSADLGSLILGLVLILVGPGSIIFYAGITLIVLSIVYAVYALWIYIK